MLESDLQKQCNEYLKLHNICFYHLPKGRNNGQKKMGGGGLPDLLIWHKGKHYMIELKTETGTLNNNQVKFFTGLNYAGFTVGVINNFDTFKKYIDNNILV